MADERGNVPLPDEVTVSLAGLTELFAAIDTALAALAAAGRSEEHRRLDDALGALSAEVIDRLGILGDDE